MKRLRVTIIDDEAISRQRLRRLLGDAPDVEVVGEAENGNEAIELVRNTSPDVIFLDIEMPDCDGFAVADALRDLQAPIIVFVTAHDRFAVRAFEEDAADYLLKPYDAARLRLCLERIRKQLALLDEATASSRRSSFSRDKIMIKCDGVFRVLRLKDISLIEAAGNYVVVHAGTQKYTVRETLGCIEARLNKEKFLRIHRSAIINIDQMTEMVSINHGEYAVTLQSGKTLVMSRGFRDSLLGFVSLK